MKIGHIIAILGSSVLLVACTVKSEEQKSAYNICDPSKRSLKGAAAFKNCIPNNFPPGSSISKFEDYAKATDFLAWEGSFNQEKQVFTVMYILIQDYEKGPWRKNIIVQYNSSKEIVKICANEWSNIDVPHICSEH